MKRSLMILLILLTAMPVLAGPPVVGSMRPGPAPASVRTIRQSLDAISHEIERVKNRPTDFPPANGGGGGISGPLGRTCAEARDRMRWSDLPCSPFMPER